MLGKQISNVQVYGDQTISGQKTFTDNIIEKGSETIQGSLNVSGLTKAKGGLYVENNINLATTFVTPTSGQLGYKITGTNTTIGLVTSASLIFKISSLTIPAGVWLLTSQVTLVNTTAATLTYISQCQTCISPFLNALDLDNVVSTRNYSSGTFGQYAWHSQQNYRIVTVNTNTVYYLTMLVQFNNSVSFDYSTSYLIATRIA